MRIGVDYAVPQRFGYIHGRAEFDARIVDQNVDPGLPAQDLLERRLNAGIDSDVRRRIHDVAALRGERSLRCGQRRYVPAQERDRSPGMRQGSGNGAAYAAGGAGDYRDLAIE